MDRIKELFDYQMFAKNKKIEAYADAVYFKYLAGCTALDDDELDCVAAAGEVYRKPVTPIDANEREDG